MCQFTCSFPSQFSIRFKSLYLFNQIIALLKSIFNFTHQMSDSNSSISTNNKLSNFENFKIYSTENDENSNKQKLVENEGFNKMNEQEEAAAVKPTTKRAPLKIQCTNNVFVGLQQQQIPAAKKRTERFEIFTGENIADEEAQKPQKEDDGTEEIEGNAPPQNSPGKENIAPVELGLAAKNSPFYEKSFGIDDSLFEDEEDESAGENSPPSEYLTAKSSVILLSTKQPKPQEKNSMYICYNKDIYNWMLYRERIHRPKHGYMAKQTEINEEMRKVLVDWFVDVAEEFELCRSSFFLAVFITDRALSKIDCPRDKLQLLGATAILIATKIQEIFPPQVKDIVYVTDDSYTEHQVRRMEKIILKMVDYQLNVPLVDCFAEYFDNFASNQQLSQMARHLMWNFLELASLEFQCVRFLPSHLAAAAFILASHFQQQSTKEEEAEYSKIWSSEIEERMQIKRADLAEPAKTLIQLHKIAFQQKSQSVRKKYSVSKRCHVANISMPEFEVFASQFEDD